MKNLIALSILLLSLTLGSCFKDYLYSTQLEPTVPDTYEGRPVDIQGTVYVSSKDVTFFVWDSGQIDGDIITLIVNGKEVISYYTLTGSKYSVDVSLSNKGYNWVMLYAHNEGDVSPNTCALSIDDGINGEQTLTLSADLTTNGAYNIYVE